VTVSQCPECGARYTTAGDSCDARFSALLALDHSRHEPWGSRHGQAFAALALEHPIRHATSLEAAWNLLYRIYRLHEPTHAVVASLRQTAGRPRPNTGVPPRSPTQVAAPQITIADLSDFAESTYPAQLDAWCRAALASWDANHDAPTA
jgi:hypothetical protein